MHGGVYSGLLCDLVAVTSSCATTRSQLPALWLTCGVERAGRGRAGLLSLQSGPDQGIFYWRRALSRVGISIDRSAAAMKGDRVEIVIDAGSGTTRTYEIGATRAGRKVVITHGRGVVEVSEATRGGSTVRTARFLANRVLALVEHPAGDGPREDDEITPTLRTA